MKWLPPSQRGLNQVSDRERKSAYELTKLYRVERRARRLLATAEKCRWIRCFELSAAVMGLREALEQVDGWSDRFFSIEGDGDE